MQVDGANGRLFGGGVALFGFELEALCSEVQEEAVVDLGGGEVIDQLDGLWDGQGLHGFKFNDHLILNDEVSLEYTDFFALVKDGQNWMNLELDLRLAEFNRQSFSVNRFYKSATQTAMNFHRKADDPACGHFVRR